MPSKLIEELKDSLEFSRDTFEESRKEANLVLDYFHNRQWTEEELAILEERGQPAETFNIIKAFARLLLGYYSTVVNSITVDPVQFEDIDPASILNDLVKYTLKINQFQTEGDKIKLDGLLTGLMCSHIDIVDSGRKDRFGRTIYKEEIEHVPVNEILIDPMSIKEDYSDASFLHRYRWLKKEQLLHLIPSAKGKIESLDDRFNWTNIEEAEFEETFDSSFTGLYRQHDFYLVVHSIWAEKNKRWSYIWHDETILEKKEITFKEVKFPYRVQKIHTSDKAEYYGIFREVIQPQRAINQAVVKIQLMVNSNKVLLESGAVEDMAEFTRQYNRVNSIVNVLSLKKIQEHKLNREIIDAYTIIDKSLDRIQRVLGINDSFLGQAFASDSGRKVKLQSNASILALRYVSSRIEQYYRLLGWDMVNLFKQYFTAEQVFKIADETVGDRWVAVNVPLTQPTGELDPVTGEPLFELVFEPVVDPATGEPEINEEGELIIAPVPTTETDIAFTDVDITVDSSAFNDQDEKAQLMLETFLNGPISNALSQVNPAGYFKVAELLIRGLKSKYSPNIANILGQTAAGLQQSNNPPNNQAQSVAGQLPGRQSSELKLPQNTNED
jgi:hypothetical protein